MVDKIASIGQSIQIKGELTGNEDLTVEGKVDGKISLKDHNLTIGPKGRITAEIHAKTVQVVGEVVGNITADDKVEVAATGSMKGDIITPLVVLADGARFKGSIDREPKSASAVSLATNSAIPELARPDGRDPTSPVAQSAPVPLGSKATRLLVLGHYLERLVRDGRVKNYLSARCGSSYRFLIGGGSVGDGKFSFECRHGRW